MHLDRTRIAPIAAICGLAATSWLGTAPTANAAEMPTYECFIVEKDGEKDGLGKSCVETGNAPTKGTHKGKVRLEPTKEGHPLICDGFKIKNTGSGKLIRGNNCKEA